MGYFPCAPVRPTLAVDIALLEFVSLNFSYLAPNVTGWAETLQTFWRTRGYILGPEVRHAGLIPVLPFLIHK